MVSSDNAGILSSKLILNRPPKRAKIKHSHNFFVSFIRVFRANLSNPVKLPYKRLRSRLILAAAY